ncbi:MAG: hypothetical protein DRN11_01715 [Thermoplasmata archaeon]|nr:MAG: hypothetical protein DRN11_01715 [Thermoplasmata archaeon]
MNIMIQEIEIEKPEEINFILGQSHFIKSVEDLYEVMANVPNAKFGIAFCEASGKCLIRYDGNDEEMIKLAIKNAEKIAAGHSFIIFMKDCYPINVLNAIKNVPEVCRIYCATANPTKVLIYETKNGNEVGRAIIGVVDGYKIKGIENEEDKKERKEFLRKIGYKR